MVKKKTVVNISFERARIFLVQYQEFSWKYARGLSNPNGVNLSHFRWNNCKEVIYYDKRQVVNKKTATILLFERARTFWDQNASQTGRICPQAMRLPHPKSANDTFLRNQTLENSLTMRRDKERTKKDCYNFAF